MSDVLKETWFFYSYEGDGGGRHKASVCNDADHICLLTAKGVSEEEAEDRASLASVAPEAVRMLVELEWSGTPDGDGGRRRCPVCFGVQPGLGAEDYAARRALVVDHHSDCPLIAMFKKAGIR